MPKLTKDKTRINITINSDLNNVLTERGFNKSALIESLLYKYLALENNKSQVSSPKTPNSIKSHFRDLNPGPLHYQVEDRDKRQAYRDKSSQNLLFSVYKKNRSDYIEHIGNYSQAYANGILYCLDKLSNLCKDSEIKTIFETIKTEKINLQYSVKGIRAFLNFCEKDELLPDDYIELYLKKFKIPQQKGRDTFVPTDRQIKESLRLLEEKNSNFVMYYKFMIESGCRFTEFLHLVSNYDDSRIEVWNDEVVCYRNFYNRHNKQSFYFFFSYKLYQEIKDLFSKGVRNEVKSFQNILAHQDNIIKVKYLRKYNFTKMIESGISIPIADFIQSRTSKNVGVNHYLATKVIAVREYSKLLPILK